MTEVDLKASSDVSEPTGDVSAPSAAEATTNNTADAAHTSAGEEAEKTDHTTVVISGQDGSGEVTKPNAAEKQTGQGGCKGGQKQYCTCCPCQCTRAVVCTAVGVMVAVYLLALGLGLGLGLGAGGAGERGRRAVGAVAADHTDCSDVGRDILARNGSAVDSAIATLLCVGVRQPHSMGIGGGLFLVVYNKESGSVDTYDGREVAPLASSLHTYINSSFPFGKLSIGVPGEVLAYWRAHQKHGRLPWKELFAPAIGMAANGHPLSYSAARALRVLQDGFGVTLSNYTELCKIFCKANGWEPKEEGEKVKMPALAVTLRGIAAQGPDYLYSNTSAAARALVQDVQSMGGLLTMEDLQKYRVVQDPPLSASVGNLTLHTLTAPSGGPILALITRILHGLNLKPSHLHSSTTEGAMWHKVVEAFKFAYADRQKLGDPAFVDVSQLLQKLASPAYALKLRDAIDPKRTYDVEHYTNISNAPFREEGTTHISVLGPDGDAVSATSSVNYYFGSLLVSPSTGIILNNIMADFAMPPPIQTGTDLQKLKSSSPNLIEPGKRPLSSMAPAIVVDKGGYPRLIVGSAGGARITNVNAQVMARILWLGQSLEEAISAKRLHHQLIPNVLKWEFDYPQTVLKELAKYGHTLVERKSYMAVAQAVSRDPATGEVSAFSDPRKHALARLLYSNDVTKE